jgi:hypothetical protein
MGFSEPHDPPFSLHFSCTALTDTKSQSRNNSPDSAASKTAPVSRDGLIIRRKTIFGGFFDNMKASSKKRQPRTPKSARQIVETPAKSLFM